MHRLARDKYTQRDEVETHTWTDQRSTERAHSRHTRVDTPTPYDEPIISCHYLLFSSRDFAAVTWPDHVASARTGITADQWASVDALWQLNQAVVCFAYNSLIHLHIIMLVIFFFFFFFFFELWAADEFPVDTKHNWVCTITIIWCWYDSVQKLNMVVVTVIKSFYTQLDSLVVQQIQLTLRQF